MQGNVLYHLLGLMSEVGELAEYVHSQNNEIDCTLMRIIDVAHLAARYKRKMRDNGKEYPYWIKDKQEKIESELGDILWYLNALASDLTLSMDDVAKKNVEKLHVRQLNGTLQGKGDDR